MAENEDEWWRRADNGGHFVPTPTPYQPATRTMASWALTLGLLPCLVTQVVAVVLARTVLGRSKDGRDHGRGLAIGALWAVAAWVVVAVAVGTWALVWDLERADDLETSDVGDVGYTSLKVGDCVELPGDMQQEIALFRWTPCDVAHDGEVFLAFDLTGEWPGDRRLDEQVDATCLKAFPGYFGVEFRESALDYYFFRPQEKYWELGDLAVACVAYEPVAPYSGKGKQLTGTLRNTQQVTP